MKNNIQSALSIIFLTISVWLPTAHASGLPVVKDFTIEAQAAQKKQVPILVLFTSESCRFCKTVLNDFLLPMQRDTAFEHKVILRQIDSNSNERLIDFEGNLTSQKAFFRKHNTWGVPTVTLFDSQGTVLASIVGLLTVDYYYAYLESAINESLGKIKASATLQKKKNR